MGNCVQSQQVESPQDHNQAKALNSTNSQQKQKPKPKPANIEQINQALDGQKGKEHWILDDKSFCDKGFKVFIDKLKIFQTDPSINVVRSLSLKNNYLGFEACKSLADILKDNEHFSLQELNLSDNEIGIAGFKILLEALETNNSLQKLNLSNNNIGFDGWSELESLLKTASKKLKYLNLGNNHISFQGTKIFCENYLKNSECVLESLNFENNEIMLDGCKCFCVALTENKSLLELNIGGNMDVLGFKNFYGFLETNSTLKKLNLTNCFIENQGCKLLCELLKKNTSISELNLSGSTMLGYKSLEYLNRLLCFNSNIDSIILDMDSDVYGFDKLMVNLRKNKEFKQVESMHAHQFKEHALGGCEKYSDTQINF